MICGPQCRSALFGEEVMLLPQPVFEPPPPSCIPVTLLTFNTEYLNSCNVTDPPLPLFTVIPTFNLTNKGRLTTVKTQVYKNMIYDLVLRHSLVKFQAVIPEQTVCWVASTLSQLWFPTRHKYKIWHRNHKSKPV